MPQRLTLKDIQNTAKERGGKCLSKSYVNTSQHLEWQCSEGHTWRATARDVRSGAWCHKCGIRRAARKRSLSIEDAKRLAELRGGSCLSENYKNNLTPLLWQCRYGHTWKARYSNVNNGTWCPECSSGLGERICRAHFEQLFGKKFPKSYPSWLKNREDNQMELDGYCKTLALAFEHQGRQHYRRVRSYQTPASLKKRMRDDKDKDVLCRRRGITLVFVPEIPSDLKVREIKLFLKSYLRKRGFRPLPGGFDKTEVRLREAYISGPLETFREIKNLAKAKGGKCLSKEYFGHQSSLTFRCVNGHEWTARAGHVLEGHWCAACAKRKKLTIEAMQALAAKRGGKCLSKRYVNAHTYLRWQCKEGHIWEAPPGTVNAGRWCIQCAGKARGTIEEMKSIAKKRGGKCLSKVYVNANTKLQWRCAKGHTWQATPHTIKRPSWCPKCKGKKIGDHFRLNIEAMQKIARKKGGRCLSKEYVNDRTKLRWRCDKGHVWEAIPGNVKRGSWCPECFNARRSAVTGRRTARN